jgi:hypothetical protein
MCVEGCTLADDRIHRVTIRRTADSVRAEAEVTLSDSVRTLTSSGVGVRDADAVSLRAGEDAQLSEVRRQLYAAGFSKRAIASAVRDLTRERD